MDEKMKKAKKKLMVRFLALCGIALALIGFAAFRILAERSEPEAQPVSGLAAEGLESGEQYAKLEFDTLPILITSFAKGESQLYFITDVNGDSYIAEISDQTFQNIVETLDQESGKLDETFQLKGVVSQIDENVKELAMANSYKLFQNNALNADNFSEYLGEIYLKEKTVSQRTVTVTKIIVMLGVFFLVLAFGYAVPAMVRAKNGDFGILDENNMMRALRKYLPYGETLSSGVHSIGLETEIRMIFGNCAYDGDMTLIPDENGSALKVTKGKKARFEVYVGVSQNYLILSECQKYKHYYAFDEVSDPEDAAVTELKEYTSLNDIGNCFPLTDIKSFEMKKIWMGAVECTITMKNGGFLKLMIPKRGGVGIPDHEKYRERLLARLSDRRFT